MGECKGHCAVLCNLVFTDKFKLPCAFVVIIQACRVSGVLFAKIYGKHRRKAELPFIGEADLDAVILPGDIVNNINRHGLYARLYGKINVARLVSGDVLPVHAPEDAAAHVEGDGDVLSLNAVKYISRNHGGTVHIHVDNAAFLCVFFLGADDLPANLAVRSLDEWLFCPL